MAVDVQRGRNIGMAEPDGHVLDREAHVQKIRRGGVAKIVQTDVRKLGVLNDVLELTGEIGGLDYRPILLRAYISVILVSVAVLVSNPKSLPSPFSSHLL